MIALLAPGENDQKEAVQNEKHWFFVKPPGENKLRVLSVLHGLCFWVEVISMTIYTIK